MQSRSWNEGMSHGRARITRHVCTWVSITSLFGCSVPGLSLEGRECPCVSGWVCDERTQQCVLSTEAGTTFLPQDDGPLDAEPLDTGLTDRDAEPAAADAAASNGNQADAAWGGDGEGGAVVDAGTPDVAPGDPAQDAGVVITPNPDGGSEPCEQTMLATERKSVGEYLCSSNGQYRFGLSPDGALELRTSQSVIWSSGTCCGVELAMQRDGNLVAYDPAGAPVFATNTARNEGAFLEVQDDARAVLWLGSKELWSTTAQ